MESLRPIPRRAHTKSKTGCRTCKFRKVKCDERRPLCRNCERHYTNLVACDYENQEPVLRATAPAPARPRARRGFAAVEAPSLPTPTASDIVDNAVGRAAEPLQLPATIGAGRLDPFEMRPASQGPAPSVDSLMSHYLSDFAFRAFPFYASKALIEVWWPFVRADELVFNTVLLASSLDRATLRNQHINAHSQSLLDQCITLLRNRVQDPVLGVSDHTVVAIASLAALEHGRGNMRALDMHLEGMKRIVELRGGLEMIRATNAMAANVVFWCAMVTVDEPTLLPLAYGNGQIEDMEWLMDSSASTLLTANDTETDVRDFGVDGSTANILHKVQRLSRLYTSKIDYGTPQEAVSVLSHLCATIERLIQMSKQSSTDSPVPGLSQSCRLAGCLHIFTPMSGYFPNPTLMLHSLVRDIKTSLTHMIRAVGTRNLLLLWLLSVAGITAHSIPERTWFVGHLAVVITDLDIQTWEVMRGNLISLAFHDNFCDIQFHKLWVEVRQRQGALGLRPAHTLAH